MDGAIVRRIRLSPGEYNLSDLPLKPGANTVVLHIEEDTGQRRTLEFTMFSDRKLLAVGIDEWQLAAGARSRQNDGDWRTRFFGQPEYLWDSPVLTAFYRRGLTEAMTGEAHIQGDRDVVMGGAGTVWQSAVGLFAVDGALSYHGDYGLGFAVGASYDLLNVLGWDGYRRSYRLSGEYRSDDFANVGTSHPHRDTWLSLAALYSQELPWDMSGSLSLRYAFSGHYARFDDDSWNVDLSLSKRLTAALSASFSVGYGDKGHRTYTTCGSCESHSRDDDTGLHAAFRLLYRVDDKSSLAASYDTRNEVGHTTYARNEGSGVGAWNAVVDVAHDQRHEGGSVGYIGNRAEVSLSHVSRIDGIDVVYGRFDPRSAEQRSSLRVESGIAFADGAWAFGRPVRGSFAIVDGHANLQGKEVTVGTRDSEIAHSGWFGPALVPDIAAYSSRSVQFDVPDLPLGYDLGAGAFDFFSPYKAGFRLTVGSDYTVSALGTLVDRDDKPIPLLAGIAYEPDKKDGPKVQLFTNRVGRFGAQGLAPGRWIVEMPTEPVTKFVLVVPGGTIGLFNAGTLKPAHGDR
ncbi:MAG: hypothetical protein ACREC6_10110 [Hyphomicrobiaceae bacterium]